jgi:hypothetical protein
MNWIWLILTGVAGLLLGVRMGARSAKATVQSLLIEQGANLARDRNLLLHTFRRELANIMIRRDPDNFLRIYREVHNDSISIPEMKIEKQKALLNEITSKYVVYEEFDLFGAREHVLSGDVASGYRDEDIESHFKSIVRRARLFETTPYETTSMGVSFAELSSLPVWRPLHRHR